MSTDPLAHLGAPKVGERDATDLALGQLAELTLTSIAIEDDFAPMPFVRMVLTSNPFSVLMQLAHDMDTPEAWEAKLKADASRQEYVLMIPHAIELCEQLRKVLIQLVT